MSVELKYSEECTDKDTPTLCIPSLRRGASSDDLVRGIPTEPVHILSIPETNTDDKVAGRRERDIVKEVDSCQETLTQDMELKHKLVGGFKDYIVTTNNDGLVLYITEQSDSLNN